MIGGRPPGCGAGDGSHCGGHSDRWLIQTRSHVINMPPDLLSAGDHFALEVRGDSMIEAGILDGGHRADQKIRNPPKRAILLLL